MECHNPRCADPALPGAKWCGPCGERLSRARAALAVEQDRLVRSPAVRPQRECRSPGCGGTRVAGSPFCREHDHPVRVK
jgi:hypothetical protein